MLREAALVWRLARRDLRGGMAGLPILVACLALGVAAVGGIGSLSAAIGDAFAVNARAMLGGDVSIRRTYQALDAAARQRAVERAEAFSESAQMRAMASAGGERTLVELKAVDGAYPLYGEMELAPAQPLATALVDGGAVADRTLLDRLGLAVGDPIAVGDAFFVVRAAIDREPDRIASAFSLGPRLMIDAAALPATGLLRPGALVRHYLKLRLAPGGSAHEFVRDFKAAFPLADWRVRRADEARPGLRRFVDQLGLYLTLIGLAALLIGGVGVASAARSHAASRINTLATLKCLGATPATALRMAMLETMLLGLLGTAAGLVAGAALPWVAGPAVAEHLGIAVAPRIQPAPLATAALYGVLTAALFSLWPLARASRVAAGGLFRHAVAAPAGPPPRASLAVAAALAALLALIAVATSGDRSIAAWFLGGAAGGAVALALAAGVGVRAARRLARASRGIPRLAFSNLGRPGAAVPQTVAALGAGLSALVAVALVDDNMRREIDGRLQRGAPSFFFIDIQRDQSDAFAATVEAAPGVDGFDRAPMLRGRLTAVNGRAISASDLPPDARWLVHGDIGLSFAALPPPRDAVVAGAWWPPDYDGPPLLSFDEESARSAGFDVGDRVTFSILGRAVEAEIANLRRVSWSDIALNFVAVYAPGVFDAAPYTFVGSARVNEPAETPLVRALARDFGNVSAISVRDGLAVARRMASAVAAAVGLAAAVAVAAGVAVLAGSVAASQRARLHDALVLKVLGATRPMLLAVALLEFALLGLVAGAVALAVGSLAAWGFVRGALDIGWTFSAERAAAAALLGVALSTALGLVGTWRALGRKPAPLLRTP